jgi:hypothetical protein
MFGTYIFNEVSPSSPGTAVSSRPVGGGVSSAAGLGIVVPIDDSAGMDIIAILQGATGGTLGVYVQCGMDDGNWFDIVAYPQLTAGNSQVIYKTNISPVALTSSTTPNAAPTVIGMGLNPALSQASGGSTVQGQGFDRVRLVMVAGSGTTAGAPVKVYVTAQRAFAGPYQPGK